MKTIRALSGAVGMLLAVSAAAQGPIAPGEPDTGTGPFMQPTMMRVVPYPDETIPSPGSEVPVIYSCYRIGRCSAYDLYRFRDRPNRLTRLAPEAPPEAIASSPSTQYVWVFVPVTPEENILPKYRTASQVRDEYLQTRSP
jgi:hypothetical protein